MSSTDITNFRSKKTTVSRLRHRLTLQQEVQTPDGAGGYTRSWEDVADLWAEILSWKGTESPFGAQIQSTVTHRILLRYMAGVTAGQRLVFESRAFNIVYVAVADEDKAVIEILAKEGVAT